VQGNTVINIRVRFLCLDLWWERHDSVWSLIYVWSSKYIKNEMKTEWAGRPRIHQLYIERNLELVMYISGQVIIWKVMAYLTTMAQYRWDKLMNSCIRFNQNNAMRRWDICKCWYLITYLPTMALICSLEFHEYFWTFPFQFVHSFKVEFFSMLYSCLIDFIWVDKKQ
jgi:hypothetical protein